MLLRFQVFLLVRFLRLLYSLLFTDGEIFFNLGLLFILESEDEIAAVLAHEMAHVIASMWSFLLCLF